MPTDLLASSQNNSVASASNAPKDLLASTSNEQDRDEKDPSDRMSMSGSLFLGGKIGLEKFLGDVASSGVKLAGYLPGVSEGQKLLSQEGVKVPSTSDVSAQIKNKMGQHISTLEQTPSYQESEAQHPYALGTGKIVGEIAPYLAIPSEGVGEGAAAVLTGGAKLAGMGEKAAALVAPWLSKTVSGATIGGIASQFSPSGIAGGAAGGAILPVAAKGISKLVSPVAKGAFDLAKKSGISLPVYPAIEKVRSYIPFGGTAGEKIDMQNKLSNSGLETANKIISEAPTDNYSDDLKGSLLNNFEKNKLDYQDIRNNITSLVKDKNDTVPLNNYQNTIKEQINQLERIPKQYRETSLIGDLKDKLNFENSDYKTTDAVKQSIGRDFAQKNKAWVNGNVSAEENNAYGKIYSSIKQDMQDYADKAGVR